MESINCSALSFVWTSMLVNFLSFFFSFSNLCCFFCDVRVCTNSVRVFFFCGMQCILCTKGITVLKRLVARVLWYCNGKLVAVVNLVNWLVFQRICFVRYIMVAGCRLLLFHGIMESNSQTGAKPIEITILWRFWVLHWLSNKTNYAKLFGLGMCK